MEPISNADRLVLILRQKLQERARAGSSAKTGSKPSAGGNGPGEPPRVLAPIPVEGADERPFRRAIVQNILADQLGPALINDAQFQQIVSRVAAGIVGTSLAGDCEFAGLNDQELRLVRIADQS